MLGIEQSIICQKCSVLTLTTGNSYLAYTIHTKAAVCRIFKACEINTLLSNYWT